MIIEYDSVARAIYIYLIKDAEHSHTEELVGDIVMLDKTKSGEISGIEVLGVDCIIDITTKGGK